MPDFETILYAVDDGIATITLNRPDKLNAFTAKMMAEMIAAFDLTDGDDDVRAVIVTRAGQGFCSCADLSASRHLRPPAQRRSHPNRGSGGRRSA